MSTQQPPVPLFSHQRNPSTPPPPLPKLPNSPLSYPLAPSPAYAPIIHAHAHDLKPQHYQRLFRLLEHGAAEQKQADAAEDDGRADPGAIRPFQIRFPHPQNNEAEHGEEVKRVARHAVKSDERAKFTDDDVRCAENGIENHSVDRREPETAVLVANEVQKESTGPRSISSSGA